MIVISRTYILIDVHFLVWILYLIIAPLRIPGVRAAYRCHGDSAGGPRGLNQTRFHNQIQ